MGTPTKSYDEFDPVAAPTDKDLKEMLRFGRGACWMIALPIAFVIASAFLSCGASFALIVWAIRS